MDNRTLLKITMIVSLLGIFILLIISNIEPKTITVSEAKNKSLDSRVKIQGTIVKTTELGKNFYKLTIKDNTSLIDATLNTKFASNKTIEVLGILSEYQNQTQISIEKISVIKPA